MAIQTRRQPLILWLMALLLLPASLLGQGISPDIIVAADGSGNFTKIQEAINAVPDFSSTATVIFIKRGNYNTEKLIVPANKTNIVLIGESREETLISYRMYDCSSGGFNNRCPAEEAMRWSGDLLSTSAVLTVLGEGFQAENLSIANTAGPLGQAQAVTIRADKVVFRNCNLSSYQDTLYFWSEGRRSYFENCLIIGRTDYIYGGGIVFFQSCEIRSWGGAWITAPSTGLNQAYGFVFYQCALTYALGSPRAGDDGAQISLGRPWQNYPKVAWLYCNITEKLNPLGWPDKWNMAYADTSTNLHLYEYANTGPGADRSGRAKWAGIRALSNEEATLYTAQKVLAGSDGWDPASGKPLVTTYTWTGAGAHSSWLSADNWNPVGVPDSSEAAFVDTALIITADGGRFLADLTLSGGAVLEVVAPSELIYLAAGKARIQAHDAVSLGGRMRTKDSVWIAATARFDLDLEIAGVHVLSKEGEGTLSINKACPDFSGSWHLAQGTLQATVAKSLGKARRIALDSLSILQIDAADAVFIETALELKPGAKLQLNADIQLNEFYLNGALQSPGAYSSANLPEWISGSGKVLVGRPKTFRFVGGANGNWDNPLHFVPALLPEVGETVLVAREIETTSFSFPADIVLEAGGRLRLRGVHTATGTLYMNTGTSFNYATSGTGFTVNMPTVVLGDIQCVMNSRAKPDHFMRLGGPISGEAKITVSNQRADTDNNGILALSGDNRDFSGVWDLTLPAANANSIATIQAAGAYALGRGLVDMAGANRLVISHETGAGDTLRANLSGAGRIQLDVPVKVKAAIINGSALPDGKYDASAQPEWFSGSGSLEVGETTSLKQVFERQPIYATRNSLFILGNESVVTLYNISGQVVLRPSMAKEISLSGLPKGLYFAHFKVDGKAGVLKVVVD